MFSNLITKPEIVLGPQMHRDRHPVHVYLATLASPASRRVMLSALYKIADVLTSGLFKDAERLQWHRLNYRDTAAIRAALIQRYRPATVNKMLAALRGVLKQCWWLGYMSAEEYRRAADIKSVRNEFLPRGRVLSGAELSRLMDTCARSDTPAGVRDAAVIAVLYAGGLRRAEAVALQIGDYTAKTRELRVIDDKHRKDRAIHLSAEAGRAVGRWLQIRGMKSGALFCPIDRFGRLAMRRLSDQAVLFVLQKRAQEAGVEYFAPHDLRRTYITDLLERGVDIFTVQQLAGHTDPKTTQRYDRRGEHKANRGAIAQRHFDKAG